MPQPAGCRATGSRHKNKLDNYEASLETEPQAQCRVNLLSMAMTGTSLEVEIRYEMREAWGNINQTRFGTWQGSNLPHQKPF